MSENRSAPLGKHEAVEKKGSADLTVHAAQRRKSEKQGTDVREALYGKFVPYIKKAHGHNVRGLKAGVWLLVFLPLVLAFIRDVTDSDKTAFLIIWIIGMFAIATVLIFAAYSDHELRRTLTTLQEIVPPEGSVEIGNLLPVDPEGEGWLIDPEELPLPIPTVRERKRRAESSESPAEGSTAKEKTAKEKTEEKKTPEKRAETAPKHLAGTKKKAEAGQRTGVKKRTAAPAAAAAGTKKPRPSAGKTEPRSKNMQLDDSLMKETGKKSRQEH